MNADAPLRAPREAGFLWPCWTLVRREITRFLRQRSRIVGAFGTPLVFWLLFGGGIGDSFIHTGTDTRISYLEYSYPGAVVAILLFTSVFSMISIIDDRRDGFMQGVLAAPVSRHAIVLGKVFGATVLAVGQAAIFLALAPVAGIPLTAAAVAAAIGAMILVSIAVTGLGFWMAWKLDSSQGFHALMNLVLMPMLALSGAFFPAAGAASVLQWIMRINPMTYAVALLRRAMYAGAGADRAGDPVGLWIALVVSLVFAAVTLGLSIRAATKESAKAVQ
ncbi:MAG: ABC transporter permease [Phycisphaerae bacterium]